MKLFSRALWASLVVGTLITIVVTLLAFANPQSGLSGILLWQVPLFVRLAGNGPLLGYDAAGQPMYEGTPVHLLFGLIGLAAGVPIYTVATFPFAWLYHRRGDAKRG